MENLDEPELAIWHPEIYFSSFSSIVGGEEKSSLWSWQTDSHPQNQVQDTTNSYNKINYTSHNFYVQILNFTLKIAQMNTKNMSACYWGKFNICVCALLILIFLLIFCGEKCWIRFGREIQCSPSKSRLIWKRFKVFIFSLHCKTSDMSLILWRYRGKFKVTLTKKKI